MSSLCFGLRFFEEHSGLIPFSMLEKYKPLLIESMILEQTFKCDNMIIMEQLVMEQARAHKKDIEGLETMDYQLGIFDRIPYQLQAKQLLKMVEGSVGSKEEGEIKELTDAYRSQLLDKMDELTKKEDMGIQNFTDMLLYNRNENWAKKLEGLMAKNALVIAVGAGHLPGERGVINLLRKAGYIVEPVRNEMIRKAGS